MNTGLSGLWGLKPAVCLLEMVAQPRSCPRAVPFLQLCGSQGLCLALSAPPEASKAAGALLPAAFTRCSDGTSALPLCILHCPPWKPPPGRRLGCRAVAKPLTLARAGPLLLTPVGWIRAWSPIVDAMGDLPSQQDSVSK